MMMLEGSGTASASSSGSVSGSSNDSVSVSLNSTTSSGGTNGSVFIPDISIPEPQLGNAISQLAVPIEHGRRRRRFSGRRCAAVACE